MSFFLPAVTQSAHELGLAEVRNDGIYLTAIGDAFIAQPAGGNGATLTYVRRGERAIADYVDDDRSSCTGGTNTDGPGGTPYTCVGGLVDVAK